MEPATPNRRAQRLVVLGAAGALLVLAACTGSDGGTAGAAGAAGSMSAAEQEMLDYTECLREQGIDVGDPVVEADGSVRLPPIRIQPQRGTQRLGDAREACGPPPGGAFGGHDVDPTALQDMALEFAQCMRDNGIDMPDPDLRGGGVMFRHDGPGSSRIDPDDPAFQAAREECREVSGLGEVERRGGMQAGRR